MKQAGRTRQEALGGYRCRVVLLPVCERSVGFLSIRVSRQWNGERTLNGIFLVASYGAPITNVPHSPQNYNTIHNSQPPPNPRKESLNLNSPDASYFSRQTDTPSTYPLPSPTEDLPVLQTARQFLSLHNDCSRMFRCPPVL